jgi:hypothetical protein
MRRLWMLIAVCVSVLSLSCWGDTIVLTDGTSRTGVVSRIEIGDSVELLQVNLEKEEARIESFDLDSIARIELDYVDTALFTLILKSGDIVTGKLLNSPLEAILDFQTQDGNVLQFDSDAVAEVRLGMRQPSDTPLPTLKPSFGYGLSVSGSSVSITRDAIAWFSEDWLLVASLGMQGWWQANRLNLGVTNGLTYLRRIGALYWGVGTTASYDMTALAWHAALHFRVVIPLMLTDRASFLSLSIGILRQ